MVEEIIRKTSKKSLYKWSIYINVILFFIVAVSQYYLIIDCLNSPGGTVSLEVIRDIAFLAVALTFIFFQFFKNLFTIMRRSL